MLIITSRCHLPVCCRSLVDRCGFLGSSKPQIYYFYCWFDHTTLYVALAWEVNYSRSIVFLSSILFSHCNHAYHIHSLTCSYAIKTTSLHGQLVASIAWRDAASQKILRTNLIYIMLEESKNLMWIMCNYKLNIRFSEITLLTLQGQL